MLQHWIWYAQLEGMTLPEKQALLQHFTDPEDIYCAEPRALRKLGGKDVLWENRDLSEAERILRECRDLGIALLTCQDPEYPRALLNIYDPPLVLYYRGRLPDWERAPAIGIVGTRKATPYGLQTARQFGRQISACGGLVVSGAAAGIDAEAMWGALEMDSPVVAVLAFGADVIYPKSNRALFARCLERGCLITEYPPRTQGFPWHFPARNRILTGISQGLVVVEAPKKSGALISAGHAWDQGREVFAVPGNVGIAACEGSNALLQDYAAAALSGWDVMKEFAHLYPDTVHRRQVAEPVRQQRDMVRLQPIIPTNSSGYAAETDKKPIDNRDKSTYSVVNKEPPVLTEQEKTVLAQIKAEPCPVDEVLAFCDLPAGTVKSILTRLALKGLVRNLPGGRISLK